MTYYFPNPAGDASGKVTIVSIERSHLQAGQHEHNLFSQANISSAQENSLRIPNVRRHLNLFAFPLQIFIKRTLKLSFKVQALNLMNLHFTMCFFTFAFVREQFVREALKFHFCYVFLPSLTKSQE